MAHETNDVAVLVERVENLIGKLERWERGDMPTCIRHNGRLCWVERNIKALWGILAVLGTAIVTAIVRLIIGGA
jgi:hypothetical protein